MRSFTIFSFLSLFSAATTLAAVPNAATSTVDFNVGSEISSGPVDLSLSIGDVVRLPTPVKRLTNAERFARGLGPAPPRRRHNNIIARDPTPSNQPTITRRGKIQVSDTTGKQLGYIAAASFSHAQHRYIVSAADVASAGDALIVYFTLLQDATSDSFIDISMENSDMPDQPYLGLVEGRDNTDAAIGKGNFNYGYFAGTAETPVGSTPALVSNSYTAVTGNSRSAESAVFSVDLTTHIITAQWINPDGSLPAVSVWAQSNAIYFGGDQAAFVAHYPSPATSLSSLSYPFNLNNLASSSMRVFFGCHVVTFILLGDDGSNVIYGQFLYSVI